MMAIKAPRGTRLNIGTTAGDIYPLTAEKLLEVWGQVTKDLPTLRVDLLPVESAQNAFIMLDGIFKKRDGDADEIWRVILPKHDLDVWRAALQDLYCEVRVIDDPVRYLAENML